MPKLVVAARVISPRVPFTFTLAPSTPSSLRQRHLLPLPAAPSPSMEDEDDLEMFVPDPPATRGQRIMFSDNEDEENPYDAFRRRTNKTDKKRKAGAATFTSTTAMERAMTDRNAMVGRKPKTTKRQRRRNLDDPDNELELPDETIPRYITARRKHFDDRLEKLGDGGLREAAIYDDLDLNGGGTRDNDLARLEERPHFPDINPPNKYENMSVGWGGGCVPAPIARYLKPYQLEGADFMMKKFVEQKGAILGDDMGLGKTIQVIAFFTAVFGKYGDERDARRMRAVRDIGDNRWYPRVLLVCPGTLMRNWQNELERWGWWHVYVYHGGSQGKDEALGAARNGRLEILITTYDSYRLSQDAINEIRWDCVIADECHKIKERKSEITKAMNAVNSLCRIGLTGTAIQNKYEELWTLLNWTNPGQFSSMANWKSRICIPLKIGQSHDATYAQLATARRTAEKLSKTLLKPFFLRRTKALIAHQLPKKSDRVIFCPLTEEQSNAYDEFCDHPLLHTMRHYASSCDCGSGKQQGWCCYQDVEGIGPWHHQIFPVLHTLQKLANHLGLLVPTGEEDPERHDKELRILQMVMPDRWKEFYKQRDYMMMHANAENCGKWKVLSKLLKFWHDNGDKVLVFSHSVRLLKMLRTLFNRTAYSVSYLDGSMSYEDRQTAVDQFNSNPGEFVFLISTKAGGVGLNITSANKVVVVDPNWNPAYDLQAQDRAYRIGQVRDVEVFRLISVGTVEEIVYARQIYKQQQANIGYDASVERRYFKGVQDRKEQKGEIFGLANLFAPLKQNVVLQDIVNKTNIAETRAGVEIVGLDLESSQEDDEFLSALSDNTKEEAAMSLLAQSILDGAGVRKKMARDMAKKKDPVQAILASAGVEYTHENAQVIGTSKREQQISSRAQKTGTDVEHGDARAFAQGSSQAEDSAHEDQETSTALNEDDEAIDTGDGLGKIRYKYRPPLEIRKRQFCSMARQYGYDDMTEFAMMVEGWTQQQRRDFLEDFYLKRRKMLAARE